MPPSFEGPTLPPPEEVLWQAATAAATNANPNARIPNLRPSASPHNLRTGLALGDAS